MFRIIMANIITVTRIVLSIVLMFCPTLSLVFFVLYLAAGATDIIDGAVARKTGTISEFGSRLDTVADIVFVVVCLVKLLPVLDVPVWLYIWIAFIAIIKVANIVVGYIRWNEFVSVHSWMNKAAGVLLFVFPLTLTFIDLKYSVAVVCVVATVAAVQEGYLINRNCGG